MLSPSPLDPAGRPSIAAEALARRIAGLTGGERFVVVGLGRDGIGAVLAEGGGHGRGALLVADEGLPTAEAIVERLLDDLADLARDRWPHWHGAGAGGAPAVPDPWLKAASKRAGLGLPPRFPRLHQDRELARLSGLIDPAGIVLVFEVDPASAIRARPAIEALDWCARHGAAVAAGLACEPPGTPPYDRLLYGARAFVRPEPAAAERFIAPTGMHPASAIERRVAEALAQAPDLEGLFVCNAAVPVGDWGALARVDLLCRAHRIVVELDGPEHRAEPKFGHDRHRDYELLTAGYLVLRLTNDQVAADLPLALDKIRAVVRLRLEGRVNR